MLFLQAIYGLVLVNFLIFKLFLWKISHSERFFVRKNYYFGTF